MLFELAYKFSAYARLHFMLEPAFLPFVKLPDDTRSDINLFRTASASTPTPMRSAILVIVVIVSKQISSYGISNGAQVRTHFQTA